MVPHKDDVTTCGSAVAAKGEERPRYVKDAPSSTDEDLWLEPGGTYLANLTYLYSSITFEVPLAPVTGHCISSRKMEYVL